MKRLNSICTIGVCLLFFMAGCQKEQRGNYASVNPSKPFAGNTYEYLKSKPGIFDSLLYVIDRLNLADTLRDPDKKVTLFAVTNASFKLASDDLNLQRLELGLKPVYLNSYELPQLDSIVCRYIFKGAYSSEDMTNVNGLNLSGIRYNYPMNAKTQIASAVGQAGGGPLSIVLSNTNQAIFKSLWSTAIAYTANIATQNGFVHIIDDRFNFGFANYSRSTSQPYLGTPFQFPIQKNIDSKPLEAENFDKGGNKVAYFDNTNYTNTDPRFVNAGGQYRIVDEVDLYAHGNISSRGVFYPAGFRISSMPAGEWVNYTINVPEEGDYIVKIRYGVANNTGNVPSACHLTVNWKQATPKIPLPVTGTSTSFGIVPVTIHFKPGRQYFTIVAETSNPGFDLDSFVITRIN